MKMPSVKSLQIRSGRLQVIFGGITLMSCIASTSAAFSINPLLTFDGAAITTAPVTSAISNTCNTINKACLRNRILTRNNLKNENHEYEHGTGSHNESSHEMNIHLPKQNHNQPRTKRPYDLYDGHENSHKSSRRALLKSIVLSSATITGIITGNPLQNAFAEDEDLLEIDQKKVVMQVSAKNVPKKYGSTSQSSSSSVEDMFTEMELRRIDVFEKAAPSVVFIDTYVETRDAFSTNVMEVPVGTGSGFVWDDKGHIVTNYHVVRSAKSAQIAILSQKFDDDDDVINVSDDEAGDSTTPKKIPTSKQQRLASSTAPAPLSQKPIRTTTMRNDAGVTNYARKVYKAKVVGVDPGKDIAVLKIDAPVFDLYPIDVGTSTGLKVGQSAYAIGNPFGLDHTLTVGVVSGIGREVKSPIGRPITNVIQTDAAINPGNSGGPLLNSAGKLIGMNTSIYSPSGASAGIGFAIPVDSVKFIVETLIRDGKVVRPVLGISFLESKQARALGIEKGVLVLDVPTNSPAFKAGMKGTTRTESGLIEIGDIIIKVENMKINTEADLFAALESFKPGDVVKVTVNRVDLETPNAAKLSPKVLMIPLRASSEMAISRFLYSGQ